jgi:hypothetical protein
MEAPPKSHGERDILSGRSWLAIALLVSMLVIEGSAMTVSGSLRRTGQAEPGGEQTGGEHLQPDSSSRHATTPNGKVRSAIEALRLVTRWRCLRSHGRGHRFETVTHTT